MSIEEYRSPIFNFTEEELQSRKRIKGMLDFKIIYAKEDDFMSIAEIKERLRLYKDTDDSHYTADVEFLLEQNQRLVEALEKITADINLDSNDPAVLMAQAAIALNNQRTIAKEALQAYKLLEKKD